MIKLSGNDVTFGENTVSQSGQRLLTKTGIRGSVLSGHRLTGVHWNGHRFPPPSSGCVLYLPGYPAQGSVITDYSGKGHNGTLVGATWARQGTGLWSPSFDGNDYISFTDSTDFNMGTGDLAMEAWAKTTSVSANRKRIACYEKVADATQYVLSIHTQKAEFFTYAPPAYGFQAVTGSVISTNTWYHLLGVRIGTTGYIYVNAGSVGSNDGTAQDLDAADVFNIGRAPESGGIEYWNGNIALFRLYKAGFVLTQLLGHYQQERHMFGI